MASPFSIFRKYTKPMMVALCGMAILAFVVADPLMQYWSNNARGGESGYDGSQVVVTWKDGKLTEDQLRHLVDRRILLMEFLKQIYQAGYVRASAEGAEDLQLAVAFPELPTSPSQRVEEDVVRTRIIAEEARRMGMAVSDDAVRAYLDKLGRNRISFQEMKQIFDSVFGMRQGVTTQFIMDAVREELLKQNFLASYSYTIETHLPAQRWEAWLQVNDRVIVEAAAVKTSDYISKVPDPTDAELLAFYDKYKNREAMPDQRYNLPSSVPGFKVPQKVQLQYLEGNFDEELQRLKATITDEEIAKYYEDNKELFVKTGTGFTAEPAMDTPAADPSANDAEKELFDVPMGEKPEAESESVPNESAESPVDAPEANAKEANPEEPEPPKDEQARRSSLASPFRLVSFQEAAESDEPAAEGERPAEESPSESQPAEEKPAADSSVTEEVPAVDTAVPGATPAAEQTPIAEKPIEYQSLDEVREDIRTLLARRKVNDTLREKMKKLRDQLQPEYLTYFDAVLNARMQKKPAPGPPTALEDLQALAQPNGLTYHDTGLLSMLELLELEVGKSVEASESASHEYNLTGLALFRLKDYQPVVTRDLEGNFYLAMKTADKPSYVPKLEEIRDEVVQALKREKASELALTEAKRLAEEIEKTGETLGDKFTGDPNIELVVTDPFSRLDMGETSPTTRLVQFRLSDPAPIVAAGPELLEKVFELGEGEVAAEFNHDHSIAYILRVQKHLESPEELRQNYLADLASGYWRGGPTIERNESQNAFLSLLIGLMQDAGLNAESWKRMPDQVNQEDGG